MPVVFERENGPPPGSEEPDVGTSERPDGWEELRREIARSRRYGHGFVLIRIPQAVVPPVRRARWRRSRRPDARLRTLRSLVRVLDRVWASADSLYVLLPESDRTAGEGLLARLKEAVPGLVPERGVRLVAFPADGLTSGALLEALERPEEERILAGVRKSA